MKITALMENTSANPALRTEHGLSFYMEANGRSLLMDTGAGGGFAENAEVLGVDLGKVELAVLSHGHYDHGGGIRTFLDRNRQAPVYLRKSAFDGHYTMRSSGLSYIGLDPALRESGRLIYTDAVHRIDGHLLLFSEVPPYEPLFVSNDTQFLKTETGTAADDFRHEQNLIVEEGGRFTLLAGCAHSGICNILRRFRELCGRDPDTVIGGFHLMIPSLKKNLPDADIDALAHKLRAMGKTQFYTCHCTGAYAFERLREILGDQVRYFSAGLTVEC